MQMTIRERTEQNEHLILAPCAAFADSSRGREREDDVCSVRTAFQRDRDRIIHCKSFRRLKHKTQVYLAPEGDHYRTRLTHTLEVSQIARTIARSLRLNEDLTEAISLGHDLGHTPFGHAGERALDAMYPGGFRHFEHSVRVVRVLENDGRGLNLTREVLDGILCHTRGEQAFTLEGRIVRLADKIAYLNHDIDDSIRAGILTEEDIPAPIRSVLGSRHSVRINRMIISVIENSTDSDILMSEEFSQAFAELSSFMFKNVYLNPKAKGEEGKAEELVRKLYTTCVENPSLIPSDYAFVLETEGAQRAALDYVASMSDRFAVTEYQRLFVPESWGE